MSEEQQFREWLNDCPVYSYQDYTDDNDTSLTYVFGFVVDKEKGDE